MKNSYIRLTEQEITSITQNFVKHFGINDHLWIFGSRADPHKKGGDLDLYIETNNNSIPDVVEQKIKFLVDLKKSIGEQKVDVIINIKFLNKNLAIYEEAKNSGVMLI